MKNAVVALLFALPALAQDYRFDEVKRTVALNEKRISKGDQAKGGDAVETGWFSYALIAAEGHRARFEIFGSTEVKLAEGTPGVLLSLERGRIRAAFDKITGSEPRVVKTPGALLAVRGTQFDVRVDRNGITTVDVYEGVVEVQSPLQREPVFVRAGEESTHSRNKPPVTRPMPEHRRRDDPNRRGNERPNDRTRRPDDGGNRGRDGGQSQPPRTGGHYGGGNQPAPPPPPPPRRPPE
jgi:hypothetical protein